MLTQVRLKELLTYNFITGQFTWNISRGNQFAKAGSVAGWLAHGYVHIEVDGRDYRAHRLAWLYMTGEWPSAEIDHINRVRHSNGWINLRQAAGFENCQNVGLRRNNKSGFVGVDWHKASSKWRARIMVKGKNIDVGYFDDPEVAAEARAKAKIEHHTFHPEV